MKYFANYNANNGTSLLNDLCDTNLRRITKDIRDIAEGNRYDGNECRWRVTDETGRELAAGGMDRNGCRYRTI